MPDDAPAGNGGKPRNGRARVPARWAAERERSRSAHVCGRLRFSVRSVWGSFPNFPEFLDRCLWPVRFFPLHLYRSILDRRPKDDSHVECPIHHASKIRRLMNAPRIRRIAEYASARDLASWGLVVDRRYTRTVPKRPIHGPSRHARRAAKVGSWSSTPCSGGSSVSCAPGRGYLPVCD